MNLREWRELHSPGDAAHAPGLLYGENLDLHQEFAHSVVGPQLPGPWICRCGNTNADWADECGRCGEKRTR